MQFVQCFVFYTTYTYIMQCMNSKGKGCIYVGFISPGQVEGTSRDVKNRTTPSKPPLQIEAKTKKFPQNEKFVRKRWKQF